MRMKKITILTSAALLASTFALTSCGNGAEDVDFAKYSTEISYDDYQKAHQKYAAFIDVTNGYDFTNYSYSSIEVSSNKDYTKISSTKSSEKYDKANSIVESKEEYLVYNNEDDSLKDGKMVYESIIQKNGEKYDVVNQATKTYDTYELNIESYIESSLNLSSYVDMLTGSISAEDTTRKVKYYGDNDVYTLVFTVDATDEHEQAGIKFNETTSTETIFQFYVSDTEVYGKLTTEKTINLSYTEGETTGKVKKVEKTAKYAILKIGEQTISKVDTSTYTKVN